MSLLASVFISMIYFLVLFVKTTVYNDNDNDNDNDTDNDNDNDNDNGNDNDNDNDNDNILFDHN